MLKLKRCHHIAIICSDYKRAKSFYIDILGLTVERETYRNDSASLKVDLALNGEYIIELFTFPDPPKRVSRPEATGLRHLAFEVDDLDDSLDFLNKKKVKHEPIRVDGTTGKRFTFIFDPDDLPIELYEK